MDRAKFWGKCGRINLSANVECGRYIVKQIEYFNGKDILEIGPGMGRQCNIVVSNTQVKSYSIADITDHNFNDKIFSNFEKIIISPPKYKGTNKKKYDVIHCWFVVHHVPPDELDCFLGFVARHLKRGGHFIFNFPCKERYFRENYCSTDGIKTAPHTKESVFKAVEKKFELCEGSLGFGDANSYWCILRKK